MDSLKLPRNSGVKTQMENLISIQVRQQNNFGEESLTHEDLDYFFKILLGQKRKRKFTRYLVKNRILNNLKKFNTN